MVVQVLDPSTLFFAGRGYSPALAALLREAARSGLVTDFTNNRHYLQGRRFTDVSQIPGWTYTRSGTRFAGDTALTSFSANVPRIVPGSGIRVTAGATNLALRSSEFTDAAWAKTNATIATGIDAPDGSTGASTITATATNGQALQTVSGSLGTGTTYTISLWVRRRTGSGTVWLFNPDAGGVFVISPTSSWQRFSVSGPGGAASNFPGIRLATNGDAVDIWGAQLETGSTATDYIPTTTASATAGADAASVTGLTFSGAHSLIAITGANAAPATGQGVVQLDDGTNTNRSLIYAQSSNSRVFIEATTVQANQDIAVWQTAGARIAGRFQTNDVRGSQNGTLGAADTVATLPAGTLSRLLLGLEPGGARYLEGWLRLVAIVPRAINDTELGATA